MTDHEAAKTKADQFTTPAVGFTYSPDVINLAACYLERDRQYAELRRLAEEYMHAPNVFRVVDAKQALRDFLERNPK